MAVAEAQQEAVFEHHPTVAHFAVSLQRYLELHPDPRYSYIATGAIVIDKHEPAVPRVLLLQRSESDSMPGQWELPGGACDEDDKSILHAAARELYEETGLKAVRIGPQVREGQYFTSSSGKKICKFTFMAEVERPSTGGTPPVRLDPSEHQRYVWATEEEVQTHVAGRVELVFTSMEQEQDVLRSFALV